MSAGRVTRGVYKCALCEGLSGPKNIDVDHVIPATPPGGINEPKDFGVFIERLLFCPPSGLRVLCKPCHKQKTKEERYGKTSIKKKTRKRSKRLR